MRFQLSILLLLHLPVRHQYVQALQANANFGRLCDDQRLLMIEQNPSLANDTLLECRDGYEPSKPPAKAIYATVSSCLEECPGYAATDHNVMSQWIGPLVGFLLPDLAFVMSIPRAIKIPRGEEWFAKWRWRSYAWLVIALVLMLFDIIFWFIAVFAFAGPLIAGAIHETLIEHAVLRYANESGDPDAATAALTFALVGSLDPYEGNLANRIRNELRGSTNARRKLRVLVDLPPSYGMRVGIPIVFYTGAYAYALADANMKRGDNDTAHAVAFGLWYGVIVIVAIMSSIPLGIDNPASLEAIFSDEEESHDDNGHTEATDDLRTFTANTAMPVEEPATTSLFHCMQSTAYHFHSSSFRIVWLWKRAYILRKWAEEMPLPSTHVAKMINSHVPRIVSGVIAASLIGLICAGACWISYQTPSVGFGCRSVSHLTYAISQIILIGVWWLWYSARTIAQKEESSFSISSIPVYLLTSLALLASLSASIGGTIMQLVGVFHSCICMASLRYLLPSLRNDGMVLVNSDTAAHRKNSRWWLIIGGCGIGLISLLGLVGWMYQARLREKSRQLLARRTMVKA
ncbi:hypothetical protein BDV96DRAFT_562338 [Lophiotrema nucula]|uniref:Uncharacterized protein n=1 Tax=Lophiotrema nucula TaxID=690887 RepID=A0A6A5ZQP1_9PLEO|nr:hypothetical protein BDV96DRAFT_562338 [Lophiotrema nucula]